MRSKLQNGYGVPLAIVVAGLLIAGTIFWTKSSGGLASGPAQDNARDTSTSEFRIPDETDHTLGNPEAQIAIVEFSDLECPFCARLHPTLKRVVEENEDVKWIYRQFPLTTIHSRALSGAVASECIARLGGNASFWSFVDATFQNQHRLGDSWYKEQALAYGIDPKEFDSCTNDKSVVSEIDDDLAEVVKIGGRGTPYVVVVTPSGQFLSFSGALPYEQISNLIEQARQN